MFKYAWIKIGDKYRPIPTTETGMNGIIVENITSDLLINEEIDYIFSFNTTPDMERIQNDCKIMVVHNEWLQYIYTNMLTYRDLIITNKVSTCKISNKFIKFMNSVKINDPIVRLWYRDIFIFKLLVDNNNVYCSDLKKFKQFMDPSVYKTFQNKIIETNSFDKNRTFYIPDPIDGNLCPVTDDNNLSDDECLVSAIDPTKKKFHVCYFIN